MKNLKTNWGFQWRVWKSRSISRRKKSQYSWSVFSQIRTEYGAYLSVFSSNAGKYETQKLRTWTLFTQCHLILKSKPWERGFRLHGIWHNFLKLAKGINIYDGAFLRKRRYSDTQRRFWEEFGIKNPVFLKTRVPNNFGIFVDE